MSETETPVLHLGLSDDERLNRNWRILDDVMHRLAKGVLISDDLNVAGSLEVRDNLIVRGDAEIDGLLQANIVQGLNEVVAPKLTAGANGLQVLGGPVDFPLGSITGTDLEPGAAVQNVWVGTAAGTVGIPVSPGAILSSVTLDSTEEDLRWELVLAQATIQLSIASDTAVSGSYSLTLRRGSDASGTDVQTRTMNYSLSRIGTYAFPATVVRLGKPPAGDQRRWCLKGILNNTAGALTIQSSFSQLHVVQFR